VPVKIASAFDGYAHRRNGTRSVLPTAAWNGGLGQSLTEGAYGQAYRRGSGAAQGFALVFAGTSLGFGLPVVAAAANAPRAHGER
jgi:hypothetical protein